MSRAVTIVNACELKVKPDPYRSQTASNEFAEGALKQSKVANVNAVPENNRLRRGHG